MTGFVFKEYINSIVFNFDFWDLSSRKIKIILTHQVFVNKFLGLYVLNSAQPLYPTQAKIIPILQAVSSATTTTHHLMNEEELLKASNLDLSHHHLVRLLVIVLLYYQPSTSSALPGDPSLVCSLTLE